MAKRRKPTTKPASAPPSLQPSGQSSAPVPTPTSDSLANRGIRQTVKRLIDSGVDNALSIFWLGVFAVMTSTAIAIWLYIRSGQASWLYPYLYFALGFIAACLALIATATLLFYVKSRRRKALEQTKNLKFVSPTKGLLDHRINKTKAVKEVDALLLAISKEIVEVGKTANWATRQMELAGGDENKGYKATSRAAARLTKHAMKMENCMTKLEPVTDLLVESNTGILRWNLSKLSPSAADLIGARQSYIKEIEGMDAALHSIISYRDSQKGLSKWEMLQDINTSLNRLSSVTNDIIEVIQRVENNASELIAMIDEKLASGQTES